MAVGEVGLVAARPTSEEFQSASSEQLAPPANLASV